MKKLLTLLALVPLGCVAFGQAITITSTDMPMPTATDTGYNVREVAFSRPARPTVGTAMTWDYSAASGTLYRVNYYPETDTFYTNAGIDVYTYQYKSFNSGYSYGLYSEIDFNTTNVQETGVFIPFQGYDLSSITGSTTDSLIIPLQGYKTSSAKEIIHFPFTANSGWSSVSRRFTNFNLTVSAFSLSHTPAQHVYYQYRKDTVIGWGTMKVYTPSGPSIAYPVLMDKISSFNIDSFYIGGSPAPSTLLSAFSVTQGQHTDSVYRYNFYRKSSFGYLASFYYGNHSAYDSATEVYMAADKITPLGVNESPIASYSSIVFPNPSNGSEINLMFIGKAMQASKYMIVDVTGKTILAGNATLKNSNELHIDLNNVSNGTYILAVYNNEGEVAKETFTVLK